jgi:chromate transport protein ChrA
MEEVLMSYEIKYDRKDEAAAQAKAIADVRKWLGTKQFNKVVNILANDHGRATRFMIILGLSMQGIQGYPAEVMADTYWSPQMLLDL